MEERQMEEHKIGKLEGHIVGMVMGLILAVFVGSSVFHTTLPKGGLLQILEVTFK
jgi:uncharacterized protein YacL